MKKLLLLLSLAVLPACASASLVETMKDAQGWHLLVDGEPYIIKGMVYHADVIGHDPNVGTYGDWMIEDANSNGRIDGPYDAWVDSNTNNVRDWNEAVVGDFHLMKQVGINTIRIYHHASDDPVSAACNPADTNPGGYLIHNHPPNKALLRDLFNTYGISFVMGDEIGSYTTGSCTAWEPGTDYTDPQQISSMTYSVRKMVEDFKDEPGLLMYVLGNENNYSFTHTNAGTEPVAFYSFVGDMVDLIHELDPTKPVALAMGEVAFISYAKLYAPNLDIVGINAYRSPESYTGFGGLWKQVSDVWDKPVLMTEYGWITEQFDSSGTYREATQAAVLKDLWCDIEGHSAGRTTLQPKSALGGFIYAWLDNWWQNYAPSYFNTATGDNSEGTGIISQGNGTDSPYMRQPRQAYGEFEALWRKRTESCPLPGRSSN